LAFFFNYFLYAALFHTRRLGPRQFGGGAPNANSEINQSCQSQPSKGLGLGWGGGFSNGLTYKRHKTSHAWYMRAPWIEDIRRLRRDMNFMFEWQKHYNISRVSSASEWGIVFDMRTSIHIFAQPFNLMFCLLYGLIQSDKLHAKTTCKQARQRPE
jgi:hypothetical protein